jgi:pimeloyl-ACP methyl ester carboxylesterase
MLSRLGLASILVLLVAGVAASGAAAASGFAACRLELDHDVDCAGVAVQLDRTGVVAGSLELHVERIRARAKPARGTMIVLSGGPGEGISAATDDYADSLRSVLATHDLILVDQRGTGLSGALRCPPSLELADTTADFGREIAACGAALGSRLALYTTSDVVDDLEEVRRVLGVERVSLAGVSYGTRIALAYAERYPQHVERLVLDSLVPLTDGGAFRLNSFPAVPRVLREACGSGCRFTKDPGAELAALVHKLATGPLRGSVARGDARLHPARLGRADLFGLLLDADYLPLLRAHFPAAVHSALAGDPAALLRLRDHVSGGLAGADDPTVFSTALYLAARCAESSEPWVGYATPEERTVAAHAFLDGLPPSRFAPFDRATALAMSDLQFCRTWPVADRSAARFEGPLPDVPTLIVSGTADLRTPLEDARAVASLLPQAQLLSLRGVGHAGLFQGYRCTDHVLERFMSGQSIGRCPAVAAEPAALPAPAAGRRVTPLEGLAVTLDDVLGQLAIAIYTKSKFLAGKNLFFVRAGGLRGGRYSATDGALTLERVSVVPGLTVSGRITGDVDPFVGRIEDASGSLVVRRAGGGGGTLVLRGGTLRGTLAGRPISKRLTLDRRSLRSFAVSSRGA